MSAVTNFDGGVTLSFQVSDRKKSCEWYQNMLGFTMLYDVAEIGWCEMATHIPKVNVGFSDSRGVHPGGPVPTFGVSDIEVARKALEAKGVKFDGKTMEIPGMVKLATFFDPDNNALMLFQDLATH